MLPRLNKREKFLLRILIIVIFGVSALKFGLFNFINLQNTVDLERKKVEALRNIFKDKEKLIKEVKRLENERNRRNTSNISWTGLGDYLQKNNIDIVSIKPFPLEESMTLIQYKMELSLEGSLSGIIGLMKLLEDTPNYWTVEKGKIEKTNSKNNFFLASISIAAIINKDEYQNTYIEFLKGLKELRQLQKDNEAKFTETRINNLKEHGDKEDLFLPDKTTEYIYSDNYSFPLKVGGR